MIKNDKKNIMRTFCQQLSLWPWIYCSILPLSEKTDTSSIFKRFNCNPQDDINEQYEFIWSMCLTPWELGCVEATACACLTMNMKEKIRLVCAVLCCAGMQGTIDLQAVLLDSSAGDTGGLAGVGRGIGPLCAGDLQLTSSRQHAHTWVYLQIRAFMHTYRKKS